MPMNRKKSLLRQVWPLLLVTAFLQLALAEPPAGDPAKAAASEPAVNAEQPDNAVTQPVAKPVSPKQVRAVKQSNFKPTEKIGADAAVSFPVDI